MNSFTLYNPEQITQITNLIASNNLENLKKLHKQLKFEPTINMYLTAIKYGYLNIYKWIETLPCGQYSFMYRTEYLKYSIKVKQYDIFLYIYSQLQADIKDTLYYLKLAVTEGNLDVVKHLTKDTNIELKSINKYIKNGKRNTVEYIDDFIHNKHTTEIKCDCYNLDKNTESIATALRYNNQEVLRFLTLKKFLCLSVQNVK